MPAHLRSPLEAQQAARRLRRGSALLAVATALALCLRPSRPCPASHPGQGHSPRLEGRAVCHTPPHVTQALAAPNPGGREFGRAHRMPCCPWRPGQPLWHGFPVCEVLTAAAPLWMPALPPDVVPFPGVPSRGTWWTRDTDLDGHGITATLPAGLRAPRPGYVLYAERGGWPGHQERPPCASSPNRAASMPPPSPRVPASRRYAPDAG